MTTMDKYLFITGIGGAALLGTLIIGGALLAFLVPESGLGVGLVTVGAIASAVLVIINIVGIARRT